MHHPGSMCAVQNLQDVCMEKDIPAPTIVSESGRALASHHAVMIFDVLRRWGGTHPARTGDLNGIAPCIAAVVESIRRPASGADGPLRQAEHGGFSQKEFPCVCSAALDTPARCAIPRLRLQALNLPLPTALRRPHPRLPALHRFTGFALRPKKNAQPHDSPATTACILAWLHSRDTSSTDALSHHFSAA